MVKYNTYNDHVPGPPACNNGCGHFLEQGAHPRYIFLSLPPGSIFLAKKNWT
jgi:hypothetical protein